jgi:hypothetical protein
VLRLELASEQGALIMGKARKRLKHQIFRQTGKCWCGASFHLKCRVCEGMKVNRELGKWCRGKAKRSG